MGKPAKGQHTLVFGAKRSNPDVASTSASTSNHVGLSCSPEAIPIDVDAPDNHENELQPMSDFRQQQIQLAAPYAKYLGIGFNREGKASHSWSCTTCKTSRTFTWTCAADATRHARDSQGHKDAAKALVDAAKDVQRKVLHANEQARETEKKYLGNQAAKMLSIASYMVAENESHRKFPEVCCVCGWMCVYA